MAVTVDDRAMLRALTTEQIVALVSEHGPATAHELAIAAGATPRFMSRYGLPIAHKIRAARSEGFEILSRRREKTPHEREYATAETVAQRTNQGPIYDHGGWQ